MIFVEVAQKDMLNLGVSANIPFIELKKTRKFLFLFLRKLHMKTDYQNSHAREFNYYVAEVILNYFIGFQ